jgi:hypothetical protein
MVCTQNDTVPNIGIPVVMVSQSAGRKILSGMDGGAKGERLKKRISLSRS